MSPLPALPGQLPGSLAQPGSPVDPTSAMPGPPVAPPSDPLETVGRRRNDR